MSIAYDGYPPGADLGKGDREGDVHRHRGQRIDPGTDTQLPTVVVAPGDDRAVHKDGDRLPIVWPASDAVVPLPGSP